MPPRTRRKKTDDVPVEVQEVSTEVTDTADAPVDPTPADGDTAEVPERKKPGRKRSELAAAARDFEKYGAVVALLEARHETLLTRINEVSVDLDKAYEARDAAKGLLDAALSAATVVQPDAPVPADGVTE